MSAHKGFIQTSDFILYSTVLICLILQWIYPIHININRNISLTIGIILILISWTIIIVTKYQFKKHNQKSGPNNETTSIIKNGIFGYTRNPIYLGVIILIPSIGLILNNLWLIISTIPFIILIKYYLIIPEERYLLAKFGNNFIEYCKTVRRWI